MPELSEMVARDRAEEKRDEAPKRKMRRIRQPRQVAPGGPEPQAASAEPGAPATASQDQAPACKRNFMHFFHFDAQTGRVTYLDDDKSAFDSVCECHRCGTALQFETDRCPVCGTRFDEGDTGIVGLLVDGAFDLKNCTELDCPQCGEHVELISGKCPTCGAAVMSSEGDEPNAPCGKLVTAENVVFVHLDVESGEVEYLQRLEKNRGFEHLAVRLDGSGSDESQEG